MRLVRWPEPRTGNGKPADFAGYDAVRQDFLRRLRRSFRPAAPKVRAPISIRIAVAIMAGTPRI
jgi:hypothetical protein